MLINITNKIKDLSESHYWCWSFSWWCHCADLQTILSTFRRSLLSESSVQV